MQVKRGTQSYPLVSGEEMLLIRVFSFVLSDPRQKGELVIPDCSQGCHGTPRVCRWLAGDLESAGLHADGLRVRSVVCSTDEFLRGLRGTWL